jgi:lysophospholipase L1-like esterase
VPPIDPSDFARIPVSSVAVQRETSSLPNVRRERRPLPRWLAVTGLLLVGTLFSLVIAESLARLVITMPWGKSVDEMARIVPVAWTQGAFVSDSELGYRTAPGFEGRVVRQGQYDELFKTNALGLRDDEIGPRDGLTPRILVVGDSLAFGLGVGQGESFSDVLERRLDASGERVEIVNAGVVGYGLDQYDAWLARLLPQIEPDMVLISLYAGNDLRSYREVSHHLVSDGYLIKASGPVVSWLTRNSALGYAIASKRRQIQYHLGLRPEPTPAADVASAGPHIRSLAARAEASGVPLGFVVLPDRHQLDSWHPPGDSEPATAVSPQGPKPANAVKLDIDQRVALARIHLEATGVPILDMTHDLAGLDDRPIYYSGDPHLTAAGHQAVAHRLELWLRSYFPADLHLAASH